MKKFLNSHDLLLDEDVEYSVAIDEDDEIIATGSYAGNILKCLAIDEMYRGMGLSNKIVSHLIQKQYERGVNHLFMYTRPCNACKISDFGFAPIAQVDSKAVFVG